MASSSGLISDFPSNVQSWRLPVTPAIEFPRKKHTASACEIITDLHRGAGASIAFMAGREDGNGLRFAGALASECLTEDWYKLPHGGTMYFSINSTGKVYPNRRNPEGLGFASRESKDMRFLNASFIEFDRHSDDWFSMSFPTLAANVRQQAAFIGLPEPTYITYSGRGVWAIWQFSRPIPATGQAKEHWMRTGRVLLSSFAELKPDSVCSVDVTRIMRVPGSVNVKAGGHVVTFERTGSAVEFYEFSRMLGIHNAPTPITEKETLQREKNILKSQAGRFRWKRAYTGFRTLAAMRGQFREGHRHNAVFTLAKLARLAGVDQEKIKAECTELGIQGCSPALEIGDIRRKTRSGLKPVAPGRWMSLSGICRQFDVTQDELKRIQGLQSTYQKTGRTRANGQPYYRQIRPESNKTHALRELRMLIAEIDRTPTFDEAQERLASQGISVMRRSLYRYIEVCVRNGARKN